MKSHEAHVDRAFCIRRASKRGAWCTRKYKRFPHLACTLWVGAMHKICGVRVGMGAMHTKIEGTSNACITHS